MWPRIVELLMGAWLLASPLVLENAPGGVDRVVTWLSGVAVLALSGSTFAERFRRNHLGNLVVAAALIAWGWSQAPRPGPAWAQSLILTGLLLGLVAVVPTQASLPPEGWRRYLAEEE